MAAIAVLIFVVLFTAFLIYEREGRRMPRRIYKWFNGLAEVCLVVIVGCGLWATFPWLWRNFP